MKKRVAVVLTLAALTSGYVLLEDGGPIFPFEHPPKHSPSDWCGAEAYWRSPHAYYARPWCECHAHCHHED